MKIKGLQGFLGGIFLSCGVSLLTILALYRFELLRYIEMNDFHVYLGVVLIGSGISLMIALNKKANTEVKG